MAVARARSRRSPTAAELATWRGFIEMSERLRAVVEARLQADSGLSSGDYAVLLALSERDNRLRPSELAERIAWDRTRLSHHLGRMEHRGLVRRQGCPTDSRGVEVLLTDEGAAAFRGAFVPHMHAIQELFVDALNPDELRGLGAATTALDDHLRRRTLS